MNAIRKEAFYDRLPDQVEIANAKQLREIVASQIKDKEDTKLTLAVGDRHIENIALAPALAASLLEVLRLVSSGQGFRMIPVEAELTTQQAADLLNVSRPYFVKLLEEKEIPYMKVGRHRRVRAEDLFAYKRKRDQERAAALDELTAWDAEQVLNE